FVYRPALHDALPIFFRPLRALAGSSPPASSIAAATAPVLTPQKTTAFLLGSSAPFSDSPPMMIEAESAPVTKKIATSTTASTMRSEEHTSELQSREK